MLNPCISLYFLLPAAHQNLFENQSCSVYSPRAVYLLTFHGKCALFGFRIPFSIWCWQFKILSSVCTQLPSARWIPIGRRQIKPEELEFEIFGSSFVVERASTLLKRVSENPSSTIYYPAWEIGGCSSPTSKCVSKCGSWTTCIRIIWDIYYKYRFLGFMPTESKVHVIGPRKLHF